MTFERALTPLTITRHADAKAEAIAAAPTAQGAGSRRALQRTHNGGPLYLFLTEPGLSGLALLELKRLKLVGIGSGSPVATRRRQCFRGPT